MAKATEMVFIGFNSRVAALDKYSGEKLWDWRSTAGDGYVAVLLDGERLYVSVDGYTYCLDALTGRERWHNKLEGMGTGVPCITMSTGQALQAYLGEAEEARRRQSSAGDATDVGDATD